MISDVSWESYFAKEEEDSTGPAVLTVNLDAPNVRVVAKACTDDDVPKFAATKARTAAAGQIILVLVITIVK